MREDASHVEKSDPVPSVRQLCAPHPHLNGDRHRSLPTRAVSESFEISDVPTSARSSYGDTADQSCLCAAIENLTSSHKFNLLVAAVIVLNTGTMAVETDFPVVEFRGHDVWIPVNTALLSFFVAELALRMIAHGLSFFCDRDERAWNLFDFSVVLVSLLDLLSKFVNPSDDMANFVTVIRVVRVLRILRILRLFQQFHQLESLVRGLVESVILVFWTFVLLAVFMVIAAIFCANMIWHNREAFDDPEMIDAYWGGVGASMLTLFQFLTLDDWSAISRKVTDVMPLMRIFFVLYIIFAAFVILSLLTGVMADHMNELRDNDDEKKVTEQTDLEETMRHLEKLFRRLDVSGSEQVDLHTLEAMLRRHHGLHKTKKHLEKLDVTFDERNVLDLFNILDIDGNHVLSWEEFRGRLEQLIKGVDPKQILKLHATIVRISNALKGPDAAIDMAPSWVPDEAAQRQLDEVCSHVSRLEERVNTWQELIAEFRHKLAEQAA